MGSLSKIKLYGLCVCVCACSCVSECACGCVHVQGESQLSLPGFTDRLLSKRVDMHGLDAGKGWDETRITTLTVEHWYMTLIKSKYTTHTLYLHTYIHKKHFVSQMLLVGCLPKLDVCPHWKCGTQIWSSVFLSVPILKGRLKCASHSLMWSFRHKINKIVHLSRLH